MKSIQFITEDDETFCIMLQDTTVKKAPIQLEQLLKNTEMEKLSNAAILFQLVYMVALECGFAERNVFERCSADLKFSYIITSFFDKNNVDCLVQYPAEIKCDKNHTKFGMQLRSIAHDQYLVNLEIDTTAICTRLDGIVTGDFMIVTLTPMSSDPVVKAYSERSVCLTMPRYIIGTVANDKSRPFQEYLRNMDELVSILRNQLFIPVRSYHMELLNLDIYPSIMGLPFEVYEIILSHLNLTDMRNLANVNKQLYEFVYSSKHFIEDRKEEMKFLPVLVPRSTTSSDYDIQPYF